MRQQADKLIQPMPNRLALERSPYLRQHSENPVDWYPWGEEAFARARAQHKPIFLSVGYSSCHWCHVMERESFEDHETAQLLNELFVPIKVDREERPDVDETYMAAIQLYSGRGGWPMSVWLTPELEPFAAGTYFPPQDRPGHPGFKTVLRHLAHLWQDERETVVQAAKRLAQDCATALARPAPTGSFSLGEVIDELLTDFDDENGGFGSAPKFPPHAALELLELEGSRAGIWARTLEAMSRGGIHDHVGGGFHRYSTDAQWRLPHFEKMLYDNALLMHAYVEHNRAIAGGIADWLEREMLTGSGLYASALDADTEGEEGTTYTWSAQEVRDALGPDAFNFELDYDIRLGGNFHEEGSGRLTGRNVLVQVGDEPHIEALARLLVVRASRSQPERDDKCLVAWNALAARGLARLGRKEEARRVVGAILAAERAHGQLPHMIHDGTPVGLAFLDGYASLAQAVLELGDEYRSDAQRLATEMVARFYDVEEGGFWFASDHHESLLARTKPVFDSPIPSPNAIAIRVCARTGHREAALKSLKALGGWIARAPTATCALACSAIECGSLDIESKPEVRVRIDDDGRLKIEIPEGIHLNGPGSAYPLRIEVGGEELPYEAAERIEGIFSLPLPETSEGQIEVRFLACSERECFLPERRIVGP